MNTKTVIGTYGSNRHSTKVFVCDNWYAPEGAKCVNATVQPIEHGVHIDDLEDYDTFTWDEPIESLNDLILAVYDDIEEEELI